MTETILDNEQEKGEDWVELIDQEEVIDLTPEGRSEVYGGEIVARLELGGAQNEGNPLPAQEVHVVSVHEPENLDFQNLLRWNKLDDTTKARTVLMALSPEGHIAASALLMPGNEYVLGREGNIDWFKYGVASQEVSYRTPFDNNGSISRDHLHIDTAARHLIVQKNPESQANTRLSRERLTYA